MAYPDYCCPPDFKTFISWTPSIENEEKEVKIWQREETTKECASSFQVNYPLPCKGPNRWAMLGSLKIILADPCGL